MCLNFEGEKEGRSYKLQYQYTDFMLLHSVSLLVMMNILSNLTYFYYFLLARVIAPHSGRDQINKKAGTL